MTNKEAIRILGLECDEWDISHCTASERREAFEMAITALDQLDNNSTKPDNSNLTQSNGIESKVKGLTACRATEDDTISRAEAIDAADKIIERDTSGNNDVVKAMTAWKMYVEALPPVQPLVIHCTDCEDWLERQSISGFSISELPSAQPEIIRCKDCKWHRKEYYCLTTGKFGFGDNDFCSYAERRTDE